LQVKGVFDRKNRFSAGNRKIDIPLSFSLSIGWLIIMLLGLVMTRKMIAQPLFTPLNTSLTRVFTENGRDHG
jgi:hypothetical protein